jgi:uncharacterized protein involved in exopolysaccharide biosynthesis
MYDIGKQGELYFNKVQGLDAKNGEVDLQLEVLNDIRNYVLNKGRKPGTVPSLSLVNDPTLENLLKDLYDAEFELDKIKAVSGDKSEAVMLVEEKTRRIKSDILENLSNIKITLLTVKADINNNISLSNSLLKTIPQKERGLLEISRQQAIKNNIYSFLLQKREETALSSAATSSDLRIMNRLPLMVLSGRYRKIFTSRGLSLACWQPYFGIIKGAV